MKILLTGFEPFNNTDINPSEEIVKSMPNYIEGIALIKEILPVEFKKAGQMIKELLKQHKPDVVISIGQAGNRSEISIERVAINLDCVRSSDGNRMLADNAGEMPVDEKIEEEGESAYFSNLPIWDLVNVIQDKGIPVAVSYTAGAYVCNHVMYTVLYEVNKHYPDMKAGFIHVPLLPEQKEVKKSGCFMELEDMITAILEVVSMVGQNSFEFSSSTLTAKYSYDIIA